MNRLIRFLITDSVVNHALINVIEIEPYFAEQSTDSDNDDVIGGSDPQDNSEIVAGDFPSGTDSDRPTDDEELAPGNGPNPADTDGDGVSDNGDNSGAHGAASGGCFVNTIF
jgi:hypothetical protein